MSDKLDYAYKGVIDRVVDADTMDVTLDMGFGMYTKQRLRIDGFDAPETWRPKNEEERKHGEAATKRAKELLDSDELIFKTAKIAGIYGRFSAEIILPDWRNFSEVMISEGFEKREEYVVETTS